MEVKTGIGKLDWTRKGGGGGGRKSEPEQFASLPLAGSLKGDGNKPLPALKFIRHNTGSSVVI